MSTYDGSSSTGTDANTDAALQLAPIGEDGKPNMLALSSAYERTMNDNQPFVDQCRLNYETRFAIWNGQSSDGKKHAREGNGKADPTPWDGASDLRVYLNDSVIQYKVARNAIALKKANLVAVPVNGNDIERAKVVTNFMRWLINTQIPDLDREEELLSNYLLEKGVAVTGQFWQTKQEKTLVTIKLADFAKKFPQLDMGKIINHPDLEDHLIAVFEEHLGASRAKAKRMLKDLRTDGETSIPQDGRKISRPVIRAFNLDKDIFIPSWASDLETCPYIFRVEYFTAEQLRSYANTEGWDEKWVEAAIEKCRGQMVTSVPDSTLQPISRSFVYIDRKLMYTDLIGVVFGYQRLSDEDGVPGIYLTIFNPRLPEDADQPGYAKFGLLGYAHGQYPFVLHRREFLSRKIHDSRGIPEAGKSWQDQIKSHRDARIDGASLNIIPTMAYPLGRPPTRIGPGARIPERRPGEYHYIEKPGQDPVTDDSENRLVETFNEYNGVLIAGRDPTMANTLNQHEVFKWLSNWSQAYAQVWKLYQQFGDDEVMFKVIGVQQAQPQVFSKGDPTEDYDIYMSYDVLSENVEAQTAKLENIAKICATADKYGQIDYSQLLTMMLESIDPAIAERIVQPKDTATQQAVQGVQSDLAQMFSGVNHDIKIGTPPQIGLQVIQQYMASPDVQQRYQSDPAFKDRIDKYAKQLQFQITQSQNAKIGRLGA